MGRSSKLRKGSKRLIFVQVETGLVNHICPEFLTLPSMIQKLYHFIDNISFLNKKV